MVLHTHSHDDHVAGDSQFLDRPDTTIVDAGRVRRGWRFFGFSEDDWESLQALLILVTDSWKSLPHQDMTRPR